MSDTPRLTRGDMDAKLEANLSRIPEHCREGLIYYLRYGVPPGSFLFAILSNDLREACGRADEANRRALYDYIYVLYNYAPGDSWGSSEKVLAWIKKGAALRREHVEAQS